MRTNAKSPSIVREYWEDNETAWYEQIMFYCDACGMLIAKKRFVVEVDNVSLRFCGTSCAKLREQVRQRDRR